MPRLTHTRTRNGFWEGLLSMAPDEGMPDLRITHAGAPIPDVSLTGIADQPGDWCLKFPIPPACVSDGVETILILDARSEETLGSYTIVCGLAPEEDFRAELDLLRAELDMLKKAFRRHCLDCLKTAP